MPWSARLPHTAVWLIVVLLGIIATCLVLRLDESAGRLAFGQTVPQAGARGVFAFTGQLTKDTFGLFMVDVDAGTIWCYEWRERGERDCLKLVAARSWRYDRYLEDYNSCDLAPKEVAGMVELERARRLQETGTNEK